MRLAAGLRLAVVAENLILGRHHLTRAGFLAAGLRLPRATREGKVHGARVVSADSPESVKAEIEVKMGSMGMTFTGPVTIESADAGSKTVKIKANTREAGGQSNASGDVTISLSGGQGTINAVANVSGKAASMGEGTIVGVLTQLIKSFSANIAKA